MTPETPQAGKRSTAKAGNRAGGGTGSTQASAGTPDSTDAVGISAEAPSDSNLDSTSAGQPQGAGLLNQVRQKATSQINEQKNRATDGLGGVAQAVRQSTQQLRDQHHDTVAEVVERFADQIDRFSNHLRERDLDQLVGEAQKLAKSNPSMFIGTSFAAGLVAARFIKAARPEPSSGAGSGRGSESWGTGSSGSLSSTDVNRSSAFDTSGNSPRADDMRGEGER